MVIAAVPFRLASILLNSRLAPRLPTSIPKAEVRAAMVVEAVLGELADAKEAPLRRLVACDSDTNPLVLLLLTEDSNLLVRRALAGGTTYRGCCGFRWQTIPHRSSGARLPRIRQRHKRFGAINCGNSSSY